jgi:phage terminase large subunit-like protein
MPPVWSTALPDWEKRIVAGQSLIPIPALFPGEADAAMQVLDALRIMDAAGSPTFGKSSRPWMRDFARAIFGAYDPETGRRLVREYFLLISKKNGKSSLAAGIMLTALLRNWRIAGEYYIVAPTKEIADNSFTAARAMIKADDELSILLRIKDAERTIIHRATDAILKVIAADAETVSGKKSIGVLVDELWLFGKRANAENMLSEALGGLVSRPEGFVTYLSTQSDEPPAGVFKAKLEYFRRIRDGEITVPHCCPVIYEFPKAMIDSLAYQDPKNFYVTNPNLGLSVNQAWLVDELAQKTEMGAQALNIFRAKHLNVEVGQNLRADRWAGADVWAAAADPSLTLETLIDRSECIVAGIDGGGLDDLLGLCILGRERGTGRWLAWARAYANISVLRRRKAIASELIDFALAGELEVFDATGRIDPAALASRMESPDPPPAPLAQSQDALVLVPPDIQALVDVIAQPLAAGLLAIVGIDTHGVGLIVEGLKTIGVQEAEEGRLALLQGVSQGYKLHGAIKTAERKLDDRTLVHAPQRLMAWAVGNARTVLSGNAAMVTKAASGTAKIDPLMALFDAVALMSTNPEPAGSVYNADRGLRNFG